MALNFQDKQAIIIEVRKVAECAMSAVIADSCGISVNKITSLRKAGRDNKVYMRVVRNTLIRRAVDGTPFVCLKDTIIGPTLIAFSTEHPGTAARLFQDFAKINTEFKIKAAAFEGQLLQEAQIEHLAAIPTYHEAIANLMGRLKEAAAGKLVKTLAALCVHKGAV